MEEISGLKIHSDCLYFRGDLPCKPHKQFGYHCENCPAYQTINKRILIIKLGAIGDVIRTTPLLRKIRKEFPHSKITWLTETPSILPQEEIEEILKYNFNSVLYLQQTKFDIVYNLDKDKDACALFNTIQAEQKFGYYLKDGIPFPINKFSHHKYSTGLFDDISQANTSSYVKEIFEMAGWEFNMEEYVFDNHENKGYKWDLKPDKKYVGLNTGCGDRWTTRLWPDHQWIELIRLLKEKGYEPVLLGGEQEHAKNEMLSKQTGAIYFGCFPLPQFINLVFQMDVVVTQVTMAMHITIALKKNIVLMNNIFNPAEFELYGRGFLVSPEKKCDCYFLGKCKHGESCMKELSPLTVFERVNKLLS